MTESNVEFFSVIYRESKETRVRIENGLYLQEISMRLDFWKYAAYAALYNRFDFECTNSFCMNAIT